MPDNPEGTTLLDVAKDAIGLARQLWPGPGAGGGGATVPFVPTPILPRDPDGTVDWETVVGLPDTDQPTNGLAGAAPGCNVTLPAVPTTRYRAPKGYVIVYPDDPSGRTGTPIAMLKSVAKSCKLWREPAKPPIKASDWRCLRRAGAVVNKLDRVAKTANRVTGKANMTRSRGKR